MILVLYIFVNTNKTQCKNDTLEEDDSRMEYNAMKSLKWTNISEVHTASTIRATAPLKRQSTLTRLRGAVSQKAVIFILAAIRTVIPIL
jgi:hypothetical protein